jgi:hypothetical protein
VEGSPVKNFTSLSCVNCSNRIGIVEEGSSSELEISECSGIYHSSSSDVSLSPCEVLDDEWFCVFWEKLNEHNQKLSKIVMGSLFQGFRCSFSKRKMV